MPYPYLLHAVPLPKYTLTAQTNKTVTRFGNISTGTLTGVVHTYTHVPVYYSYTQH